MPVPLAVLIPALITAATSVGEFAYQAVSSGGGNDPSKLLQQQETQANAARKKQAIAEIARRFPDIQEKLGGAVAPDYFQTEGARETQNADQANAATSAWQQFQGAGNNNPFTSLLNNASQGGLFDQIQQNKQNGNFSGGST